jgi:hypothetical protein
MDTNGKQIIILQATAHSEWGEVWWENEFMNFVDGGAARAGDETEGDGGDQSDGR